MGASVRGNAEIYTYTIKTDVNVGAMIMAYVLPIMRKKSMKPKKTQTPQDLANKERLDVVLYRTDRGQPDFRAVVNSVNIKNALSVVAPQKSGRKGFRLNPKCPAFVQTNNARFDVCDIVRDHKHLTVEFLDKRGKLERETIKRSDIVKMFLYD